jgi:hypothetical protein
MTYRTLLVLLLLELHDVGEAINLAVHNETTTAVSDGSFQDTCATAAFIIEDMSSQMHMTNKIIAPVGPHNMSAYGAELTGMYTTIWMVNKICQYYGIHSWKICFGCEGRSALQKALLCGCYNKAKSRLDRPSEEKSLSLPSLGYPNI